MATEGHPPNAALIAGGAAAVFALMSGAELRDARRLMSECTGMFGAEWRRARMAEIDAELASRGAA